MKTCNKCGQQLPLEDFPLNGGGSRRPECRNCRRAAERARYRENPIPKQTQVAAYRERHPEAVKKSLRKYHELNRERRNNNCRIYSILYRPAHRELIRNQQRAWRQRRPDLQLLKRLRRRTRLFSHPLNFGPSDCQHCFGSFGGHCAYCGAKATTLDHFVPLASLDCPGTVASNMIPACGPCNFSKQNHDATKWLTNRIGPKEAMERLAIIRAYLASFP